MSLASSSHRLRKHPWVSAAIGSCTIGLLLTFLISGAGQAATPPNVLLGTAAPYAVLAGSGITNTGATTITGDTGSSPTSSETGFSACPGANCVTQTGTNHTSPDPNDGATQGAKAALTTAYNDAAGRSPTQIPTELAGQQLVGGVYTAASGTFGMTGTLTLDAQGNADTVWIFQMASTLITGAGANVLLQGGAQACNIYWQVGSAATLGTGSTLSGTVMAHDDISLSDSVTVDGRLLAGEQGSGAGAVTLIHDRISAPLTCPTQAQITGAAQAAAAATAAAAAQVAAAQAAAATAAAAAQAEAAATAQAAAAAAAQAAQAAQVAQAAAATAAAAAKVAAAKARTAKIATAKAAAAKAAASARAAKARAREAHVAAATAARTARAKKAAIGNARAAQRPVGFTG